jgi:hypothetical protein
MAKRATASNIKKVLAAIVKQCDDGDLAEFWANAINLACDNFVERTGCMDDPRGDQRS